MRIAIVITGLSTGGAEMMLLKLLEGVDRERFAFHVISLTTLGEIGPRIGALGIPVEALGMGRGRLDPLRVIRLTRRLRELRVDIVHTWLYHADLLGGLAARGAGLRTVVWGIRNSTLHPEKTSASTRLVVRLNAVLSRWIPAGILSCSTVARDVHLAAGYKGNISVIPNGFDLARFKPDEMARASVRTELRLPADAPLVGIVGRYDPQKNQEGFLRAAGLLKENNPRVHFLLAGGGVDRDNTRLMAASERAGVGDAAHFLGRRDDIPRLMASLDVLVSSASFGEAFPNVIGEAMACGVPCAVTDVGDCANIVGETGYVVAPEDISGLVDAMKELLALSPAERAALGERARARVQSHFDIRDVVRRYEDYYARVAVPERRCE
ncbi:MAG TPA: glycosyltransferase [Steroidobacteraceae bacterium]|jgi:glycosyltransferase involved in cell wall biosynthesis